VSAEVVAAGPRFVRGLTCRVCGKLYAAAPVHYCEDDFGPLRVCYDEAAVAAALTREAVAKRPANMWRYRELLPLEREPVVGTHVGMTPLLRAHRLGQALGVDRLWLKNEAASFPTLSFKDRVVAVALSKAVELGLTTVGCSSTGNLADSVAALAAASGLEAYVFVPAELDPGRLTTMQAHGAKVIRVQGAYDEANRLCSQAADRFGWGFVNVNLRPFYVEGAKTVGYEIAEQFGWRAPRHVVVPMASGGLLCQVHQALTEFLALKLIPEGRWSIHGAQPLGCNPVVVAVKQGLDAPQPVREPKTLCHSLAVGDPGDGTFAVQAIRQSGGWAEDATDEEIADAVLLLARTEGILVEPAGGVVIAATRKLIEQRRIGREEDVVLCLTGSGLKSPETTSRGFPPPPVIRPSFKDLAGVLNPHEPAAQARR
jgi:threonine synthase